VADKRRVVEKHRRDFGARRLCRLIGLHPSALYYRPQAPSDDGLRDAIETIAAEFPRYGYRRIQAELRRRHRTVNAKRIRRLMHEAHLVVQVRRLIRTSIYRPDLGDWPNLIKTREIQQPNDAWAADITYIHVRNEYLYLAVLIDLYTRGIRGWYLDRDLSEELTHRALDQALAEYPPPQIHHSDHGVQYMSKRYVEKLLDHGVAVSTAAKGKPYQNGICERFIRILKEEEVSLNEYLDLEDARGRIGTFLGDVYMVKRVHSALDYRTPAEFEADWFTTGVGRPTNGSIPRAD
jgi:putative transposase